MEEKYLVCVTNNNNNKFYHMIPRADGTFSVEYGRVGATSVNTCSYPEYDFSKKLQEKLNKGYRDVTSLHTTAKRESKYKDIDDFDIRTIVEKLIKLSKDAVKQNYNCEASAVTSEMIIAAQDKIDELVAETLNQYTTCYTFNHLLTQLFTIIPRKMKDVKDYLAYRLQDFNSIISREQSLLDNLKVNAINKVPADSTNTSEKTILEELGITFDKVDDNDVKLIKSLMNESSHKFSRAWRVSNLSTQRRFETFVNANHIKNTKLLFHGSRNENWFSIIKQGLRIRPSNAVATGSLYGDAIYFAPKCQKSIGYTSLSGSYWANGNASTAYMAIFETAYGTPYNVYSFDSKYHSLNYNRLQQFKKGANCLHAHAGANMGHGNPLKNDEIVFYNNDQMTIKYLIEIKK